MASGAVGSGETGKAPEAAAQVEQPAGACLNCGTPLEGAFCTCCGQSAHVHRSFGAFWHDLAHGVLHFEGKIWRTLPLLVWRPGELTRRYVEGERAAFVSPIAMFLFSVFLMFALVNIAGPTAFRDRTPHSGNSGAALDFGQSLDPAPELERKLSMEIRQEQGELEALRKARERVVAAGGSTQPIDSDIAEVTRRIAARKQVSAELLALELSAARMSVSHKRPVAGVDIHPKAGLSLYWLDDAWKKAKRNPSLLVYKLQSNAYKYSWALIPISVPLVWMLFLHRRRYREAYGLYDHTVFVTYSLTFMGIAAIAFTFLKLLGLNGPWALLPLLVPPLHMYRQLRGAYRLSPRSALWRTALLVIFAFVAAALFFMLLLMLGVLG